MFDCFARRLSFDPTHNRKRMVNVCIVLSLECFIEVLCNSFRAIKRFDKNLIVIDKWHGYFLYKFLIIFFARSIALDWPLLSEPPIMIIISLPCLVKYTRYPGPKSIRSSKSLSPRCLTSPIPYASLSTYFFILRDVSASSLLSHSM